MSTSTLEKEVAVLDVHVTPDELVVKFDDGRTQRLPLSWYPRLLHGTEAERQNFEIWPAGYGIEWPDLDEHLSARGLAAGVRSGECAKSFTRWLASRRK